MPVLWLLFFAFVVEAPTSQGDHNVCLQDPYCTVASAFDDDIGDFSQRLLDVRRKRSGSLQRDAINKNVSKVRVELYGMAGCPYTRSFIDGPLAETLSTAGDLVDFHFHPFGNCYYKTHKCGGSSDDYPFASYFNGYSERARKCHHELCGKVAETPAADCFSGKLLCQHGATDGMVTTAWACVASMSNGTVSKYMPFVHCTATNFLRVTSEDSFRDVVGSCAQVTGFSKEEVVGCSLGSEGRDLLNAQARQTVPHSGAPHVLVDGKPLDEKECVGCGSGIMTKVCEAARALNGKDTPPCQVIFNKIQKDPSSKKAAKVEQTLDRKRSFF